MIIATVLATLLAALLAVLAATPTEVWEQLVPFLGFVIPIAMAFGLKAEASRRFKLIASLIATLAVTAFAVVTSAEGQTAEELVILSLGYLGQAQGLYALISVAVDRWTSMESMNELPVFVPARGLAEAPK